MENMADSAPPRSGSCSTAALSQHRPHRRGREAAALRPPRLPADLHHRRCSQRHAAPHRPACRRSRRHQHHHGLQGDLSRGGHQQRTGPSSPADGPLRPSEEYRTPTDAEWEEFLGHFERRKVALGTCGRVLRHLLHPRTRLLSAVRCCDPIRLNDPGWSKSATTCTRGSTKLVVKAGSARWKGYKSVSAEHATSWPKPTGSRQRRDTGPEAADFAHVAGRSILT